MGRSQVKVDAFVLHQERLGIRAEGVENRVAIGRRHNGKTRRNGKPRRDRKTEGSWPAQDAEAPYDRLK
jgi:hypothetical protein